MANPAVQNIVKQAIEPVTPKIKNDPSDLSVIPDAAQNATYLSLTGEPHPPGIESGQRESLKEILDAINGLLEQQEINDENPSLDNNAWAVRHMQWTLLRFARVHGIYAIPSTDASAADRAGLADTIEMHAGSAKASYGHLALIGRFGKKARPESEDDLAKQILSNFVKAHETLQMAINQGLTDANNIFRNQQERNLWDRMGQNYQYIRKRFELEDKALKAILDETEFAHVERAHQFLLDLADRLRRSRTYRDPVSDYKSRSA